MSPHPDTILATSARNSMSSICDLPGQDPFLNETSSSAISL